ncbi:MAG: hypothetical protein P9L94_20450 [Candidatus Hinthialibacter antarcticus]|nr:hypothetical protein [Candidatus Hinthialibacter antarcticus]
MTSMLLWTFATIIVTASLGVNFTIQTFVKMFGQSVEIYPSWLVECHYAYYWFSAVLLVLLDKFSADFLKRTYMQDLQWMVDKVLLAHIATVVPLRLLGIPWQIAYGGSFVLTVVAPVAFASWYYPRWLKKQETEVIGAASIADIAKGCETVQRFLDYFPAARLYVFDNKIKNNSAICLFQIRRKRHEREGLMEDILLQIPVDLKRLQPVEKDVKLSRYLFYEEDQRASAFHLPEPTLDDLQTFEAPPDEFSLDKIDSALYRHPSLTDVPLPIAARQVEYEVI